MGRGRSRIMVTRRLKAEKWRKQRGQALVEYTLTLPILLLLIGSLLVAGFYAWRSVSANWGVFISAAAGGAYDAPLAMQKASGGVLFSDIRNSLVVSVSQGPSPTVRSEISISTPRRLLGIPLEEVQRGSTVFHVWRFAPGPPSP